MRGEGIPRSIAELTTQAKNYEFSKSVTFRTWVNVSKNVLREAEIHRMEGKYEEAYLLYMRFANLVIHDLPSHPHARYPGNEQSTRKLLREVENALTRMAEMRPIIEKNVEEYKKREEIALQRHVQNRQAQLRQAQKNQDVQLGSAHSSLSDRYMDPEELDFEFTDRLASIKKLRQNDTAQSSIEDHTTDHHIPGAWYSSKIPETSDLHSIGSSDGFSAIAPPVPPKSPGTVALPRSAGPEHRIRAQTEGGSPLRTVFVPDTLKDQFLKIAAPNTKRNLETCGILCGKLNRNAFFITHLVIPPQEATSDTCSTTDEELLFEYVESHELFILGWIHTHPSQSCFLSSIDLHTQNSYQIMLPEAVAIVCAPSTSPSWGVFRLTDPPGMDSIKNCPKSGFHPHTEEDLYKSAYPGHVSFKSQLSFHTKDLRE